MQNPEDISNPITALDMALELMSKAFQLNNTTPTNSNQRSSSNPCYIQIAQSGMNIDQDRQMLMVDDNVGNQFRQNVVQNVGHLDWQNAVQNQGIQNVGNQNGLIVISRITNQNPNGNGNVVAAWAEGNENGNNRNQIRCYNSQGEDHLACNCTVKPGKHDATYLQKQMQIVLKEEAGIQLTQEEFDFMADAGAYEEIERVNANFTLKDNLQQASTSVVSQIERLQARLGDQKGKSKDTPYVSNTLDHLSQKLENKNVELEFQVLNYAKENAHLKTTYKNMFNSIKVTRAQTKAIIDSLQDKLHDTIYENAKLRDQLFDKVSEQKDTNKGTSVNTQFPTQSILGKPPYSSKPKLYSVTPFPKSTVIPKVGIFRINPFKAPRVDNFVPNKHVKASVRTKLITVSQPHVITKNDVNSKTNGFSPKDIKSTTRTRRPQHKNNPKCDKVPSKSKSSCLPNKLEEIEENHWSLQSSNYPDHTSSECNNIKLAIQNEKPEVTCATCCQNWFDTLLIPLLSEYKPKDKEDHGDNKCDT
ncbi:hypothetical protein Tco_0469804 [Tanacetum coccineum]